MTSRTTIQVTEEETIRIVITRTTATIKMTMNSKATMEVEIGAVDGIEIEAEEVVEAVARTTEEVAVTRERTIENMKESKGKNIFSSNF